LGFGFAGHLIHTDLKLNTFRAELHIHTVLSPCGDIEMIPPLIVQTAIEKGISIIAITDHNQSANAQAVIEAAKGTSLNVFPGMELQTAEEIHCLCIFDEINQLQKLQNLVDQNLPDIANNVNVFGEQFIVDSTGEFLARDDRLLINSTHLSIDEACIFVNKLGGLFIPAHVNREAFGLISHLGFVPPNLEVHALEISSQISMVDAYIKFPQIQGYHLIQSGDVHYLDDFLGVNYFRLETPCISEMKMAFAEFNSRNHIIQSF
jgi:DNA polymerase III alpha subunit